ncbi:hypothetical protein BDN71DRAFT_1391419, partial [Pleurotus eryngii]
ELKSMVSTVLKYRVRLEAISLLWGALEDMPIWFHARENTRLRKVATSSASICLRNKHGVKTVGNVVTATNCLDPEHRKSKKCKCQRCKGARDNYKCTHPNSCFRRAQQLLNVLPAKWDSRRGNNQVPDAQGNKVPQAEWQTFNKNPAKVDDIQDAFHIFTEGDTSDKPAQEEVINTPHEITNVATDGSRLGVLTTNVSAGAGIYYGPNDA